MWGRVDPALEVLPHSRPEYGRACSISPSDGGSLRRHLTIVHKRTPNGCNRNKALGSEIVTRGEIRQPHKPLISSVAATAIDGHFSTWTKSKRTGDGSPPHTCMLKCLRHAGRPSTISDACAQHQLFHRPKLEEVGKSEQTSKALTCVPSVRSFSGGCLFHRAPPRKHRGTQRRSVLRGTLCDLRVSLCHKLLTEAEN